MTEFETAVEAAKQSGRKFRTSKNVVTGEEQVHYLTDADLAAIEARKAQHALDNPARSTPSIEERVAALEGKAAR